MAASILSVRSAARAQFNWRLSFNSEQRTLAVRWLLVSGFLLTMLLICDSAWGPPALPSASDEESMYHAECWLRPDETRRVPSELL